MESAVLEPLESAPLPVFRPDPRVVRGAQVVSMRKLKAWAQSMEAGAPVRESILRQPDELPLPVYAAFCLEWFEANRVARPR